MIELGRVGIRSRLFDAGDSEARDAVRTLEELGYRTLWVGAEALLRHGAAYAAASERIVIASSVASIWIYEPRALAARFDELEHVAPGRFLLGVGVSHAPIVARTAPGRVYSKPLAAMAAWLDELDRHTPTVAPERRIVAAISPKMLALAGERSIGSHPYLTTVEHTRTARALLGEKPVLAPAEAVCLHADAEFARALARAHLASPYSSLPNYTRNWLASGFEPHDLEHGLSDRLVDALVGRGGPGPVARRIDDHLAAGANHVGVQVLTDSGRFPYDEWRQLADALELKPG